MNKNIQIINPNSAFIITCPSHNELSESEKRRNELIHKLKKNTITKNRFIASILITIGVIFLLGLVILFVLLIDMPMFSIFFGFLFGYSIIGLYYKVTDIFVCNYEYESLLKVKHKNKIY